MSTWWGRASEQALRRLALTVFALAVGFALLSPWLGAGLNSRPGAANAQGNGLGPFVYELATAASGLLICWYRPRNSVGWWLLAAGFIEAACDGLQAYGARALLVPEEHLPFGALALSLSAPLWIPGVVIPVTCLLLRYPTGTITGRWARRVDKGVLIGFVLMWIGYAGGAGSVTDEVKGHRPPIQLPEWASVICMLPAALLILGGVLFSLVDTVRRTLRASYPERQQLTLLVGIAPVAVLLLLSPYEWTQKLLWSVPAAIVVGVLRYRLLGIEVVVRRTLLYGALSAVTLLVFVAVTAAVTAVVPHGPAPQVVAASVVAVGLVPARDRLRHAVDRLVYGDRGDPMAALQRLGTPLDGDDLLQGVVDALVAALRVPGASVTGARATATAGEVSDAADVVPLLLGGRDVGVLRLSHRYGESGLPAADRRLLDVLLPLVAVVLHAVELTAALRDEQEHVVAATAAERARLRRDLHDGLGPSLTGVGLGLEAVDNEALPSRSRAIVARLRAEVSASLEETRRIIDDLRPGALETGDLLDLIRRRAQHLSATTPLRVEVVAPAALPPMSPDVEAAVLRIVEEALTNVVRHAHATTCTVRIDDSAGLCVEVTDDGVGFSGPREGGVGLSSMRSRAVALGGSLELARAERGTVLVARLPA
jgi:two-component system NarL family sensor kinase